MSNDPAGSPPRAPKIEKLRYLHDDVVVDRYEWLRNREDPMVQAHIDQENAYTDRQMRHTLPLQRQIYQEIIGRLDLERTSIPVPHGDYDYYSRNDPNKSYAIHCRRRRGCTTSDEVLLDENALAAEHAYFSLEVFTISPDHRRCVYGFDTRGDEQLVLAVQEFDGSGTPAAGHIRDAAITGVAWANDSETFLYTRVDDCNRPFQVVRCRISGGEVDEAVVYEEPDEAFRVRVSRTESGAYIILTVAAYGTTEIRYLSADHPDDSFQMLWPRESGVEAYATHRGGYFYVLTNRDAPNFQVVAVSVRNPDVHAWRVVIGNRENVAINSFQAFAGHLVLFTREDGLPRLRILDLDRGEQHVVATPEQVCALYPGDNREFQSAVLRFGYDFTNGTFLGVRLRYASPNASVETALGGARLRSFYAKIGKNSGFQLAME